MAKKIVLFLCIIVIGLTNSLASIEFFPDGYFISGAYIDSVDESSLLQNNAGTVFIDTSRTSLGYVRVRYCGNNPIVKVLISKGGEESYPYWISAPDQYETYILGFGDGDYEIAVFEQAHDNNYYQIFSNSISVVLDSPLVPFIHPNFFVDYKPESMVVTIASTLRSTTQDDQVFVDDVYNLIKRFSYDQEKRAAILTNNLLYKTICDDIIVLEEGICLDYASVMAAMLRSQGIPAKLEFGYVGEVYHAWVNVYIADDSAEGGYWVIYDPTFGFTSRSSTSGIIKKESIDFSGSYQAMYIN